MSAITAQESTPPTKTINDVPPEILEMILKKLDSGENSILPYRRVHSAWKQIIDEHLEKRSLKGGLVGCSRAFITNYGGNLSDPSPTIRVPQEIVRHPGNPFPARSLFVTRNRHDQRRSNNGTDSIMFLDHFTTKFGIHLKTLVLGRVSLNFTAFTLILRPLSNLRILKLSGTSINFDPNSEPFPDLPHLTTLELEHLPLYYLGYKEKPQEEFRPMLINAFADHLVTLRLEFGSMSIPLQQHRLLPGNRPFQNLQQLTIFYPTTEFLRLSCAPPLKRLIIAGVYSTITYDGNEMVTVDVLMGFIDKFNSTLECLELDVPWRNILTRECKKKAAKACGKLNTAEVVFPKLTKLTLSYPTSKLEEAVVQNTFLVKFPALQELNLFYFKLAHQVGSDDPQIFKDIIMELLMRENYSSGITTLNRILIWFTGKNLNLRDDNFLILIWSSG